MTKETISTLANLINFNPKDLLYYLQLAGIAKTSINNYITEEEKISFLIFGLKNYQSFIELEEIITTNQQSFKVTIRKKYNVEDIVDKFKRLSQFIFKQDKYNHDLSIQIESDATLERIDKVITPNQSVIHQSNQEKENNLIKKQSSKIIQSKKEITKKETKQLLRPPTVAILGHVDHGKTSLLEAIQNTSLTAKEIGGITQQVMATSVIYNKQQIIFIDTPGHEAFSAMRKKGTEIADIILLIIAANDNVQQQTLEVIEYIKENNLTTILVITKIDKNPQGEAQIIETLSRHQFFVESIGGEIPVILTSARQKKGINELLEMILLQAELAELYYKQDKTSGYILETKLYPRLGYGYNILLKEGFLNIKDTIESNGYYGKIKIIQDENGIAVKKADPFGSYIIFGPHFPFLHDIHFQKIDDEKIPRKKELKQEESIIEKPFSLDELFNQQNKHYVILLADTEGALAALINAISQLNLNIEILHQGLGSVTKKDIDLALSSDGFILGFNIKNPKNNTDLSGHPFHYIGSPIIYNLLEELKNKIKVRNDIKAESLIIGRGEVIHVFNISAKEIIAGCSIKKGYLETGASVLIKRNSNIYKESMIIKSIQVKSQRVNQAHQGTECGISIDQYQPILGDIIEFSK
jgi:translation initiation factor IF-2